MHSRINTGVGVFAAILLGISVYSCSENSSTEDSMLGGEAGQSNNDGAGAATATGGQSGDSSSSGGATPDSGGADSPGGTNAGGTDNLGGEPGASGGGVPSGGATTGGEGGMDSETGEGGGGGASSEPVTLLSQTGLYADVAAEILAPGVQPFEPQFVLWTDGAAKRRWMYIPPGTQIDNTNPDEWKFPVGTKLWKEFERDGVRIETRMLEKLPEERASEGFEGWLSLAFIWNDDLTDAEAAPMGMQNAKGTDHDVPAQDTCGRCHDMRREKAVGFSELQLSHDGEGATLLSLSADGLLKVPRTENLVVPGDDATREVLGYLHANCGHCHRDRSPSNNRVSSLLLWLESTQLGSVEETPAYQALVDEFTESSHGSLLEYRVAPGDPDNSEIIRRMNERDDTPIMVEGEEIKVPMPPLGTELVHTEAVEKVRAWIAGLPAPPGVDGGTP